MLPVRRLPTTPSQALYLTLLKDYSSSERGKKNRPEIQKLAEEMVKVFEQYGDPKAEKLTVDDVIKAMDLSSTSAVMSRDA